MKLTELHRDQKIIVQLMWGEQKIEFSSEVIEREDDVVYVTPYIHNGSVLKLHVNGDKGIVCNLFTDDSSTGQRVSWRGVELTTAERNGRTVYGLKTFGFNNLSNLDDRRMHTRVPMQLMAQLYDGIQTEGIRIIIRDISDTGISFYAPESFEQKTAQVTVAFEDKIDEREFNIKVECAISRIEHENGHILAGCRLVGENKNYQIYGLIKRLKSKGK